MAHLIVKNFGAIKSAEIEIKKYNFFIGHTSSGKSTIAKLLAIFNNSVFWAIKEGDFKGFFFLQINNKKLVDVRAYYNFSANFLISSLLLIT